jgi:hypothetical protein
VESEVFEHIGEYHRRERSLEESEERLKRFVEQATKRGLADRGKFKLKQSRVALQQFIEMNLFILNIKKVRVVASSSSSLTENGLVLRGQLGSDPEDPKETRQTDAPSSTYAFVSQHFCQHGVDDHFVRFLSPAVVLQVLDDLLTTDVRASYRRNFDTDHTPS